MHLAMIQDLIGAPIQWNLPLWSIAVEMCAYLLFPFLARACATGRGGEILALCLGLAVLAGLSAWDTLDVVRGAPSLLRCLGGFVIGMALAGLQRPDQTIFRNRPLLSLLQISALAAALISVGLDWQICAVLSFTALVYLTSVNEGAVYRLLSLKGIHGLGLISFSLYLAHVPIIDLGAASLGRFEKLFGVPLLSDWALFSCVALAGSIAAGTLSYLWLERHSQRLFLPLMLRHSTS